MNAFTRPMTPFLSPYLFSWKKNDTSVSYMKCNYICGWRKLVTNGLIPYCMGRLCYISAQSFDMSVMPCGTTTSLRSILNMLFSTRWFAMHFDGFEDVACALMNLLIYIYIYTYISTDRFDYSPIKWHKCFGKTCIELPFYSIISFFFFSPGGFVMAPFCSWQHIPIEVKLCLMCLQNRACIWYRLWKERDPWKEAFRSVTAPQDMTHSPK